MAINDQAIFTTYQNQLASVANGVQREKDALNNAVKVCDDAYQRLLDLQTEFLPISSGIDDLVNGDPTNQAFSNMQATKNQQITDFVDLRNTASSMATAMDPFRDA